MSEIIRTTIFRRIASTGSRCRSHAWSTIPLCKKFLSVMLTSICVGLSAWVPAQDGPSPEEVIRRAAANEEKLRSAELEYQYQQDVIVQTFGEAGSLTAQLRRLSVVTYDDLGNRVDKIIEYPPSPLTTGLGIKKPDFKSLLGVDPYFFSSQMLSRHSAKFVGKQKIDELNTYAFDLEPQPSGKTKKRSKDDEADRPFKGRVWIDDQDFQMVKAEGRAVTAQDDQERFPKFEYYREYVDGKWWLPSLILADDVLEFKRFDLPIKMRIKYSDYKKVDRKKL